MSVCGVKTRVVTLNDLLQIGFWIFYSQADIDCDLVKTLRLALKCKMHRFKFSVLSVVKISVSCSVFILHVESLGGTALKVW